MNLRVNSSVKKLVIIFFLLFCCFFPQFTVFVLKIYICFIHYLFSSALYGFFSQALEYLLKQILKKVNSFLNTLEKGSLFKKQRKEKKEGKENIAICFIFNGMDWNGRSFEEKFSILNIVPLQTMYIIFWYLFLSTMTVICETCLPSQITYCYLLLLLLQYWYTC